MKKKLTIVQVAAEVAPYTKTGGLADVAGSLPQALSKLGHKLIIITPLYFEELIEKHKLKPIKEPIENSHHGKPLEPFTVWWTEFVPGIPIYFIDHPKITRRKKRIYDPSRDNETFLYFNNAALSLLQHFHIVPDLIHCHDWHTGLIPHLLKTRQVFKEFFAGTATVYTIHNLLFQMEQAWYSVPHDKKTTGRQRLPDWGTEDVHYINFAKRAILNADIISTVSEQYAEEIMTKDFGEDLQRILKNRKDRLYGIVNGIDYNKYNPETDPGLRKNYSADTLGTKAENKLWFQREVGLPENTNPPMIALTSRISEQKGFDLIMDIIDPLIKLNIQLVILGEGEKKYEKFFRTLERKNPRRVSTQFTFDPVRETQILAAADMMLLPSRFEPCGIDKLKSLRYGCIPIVRHVGGLADTITDYNPSTDKGNGFSFGPYKSADLLIAISRAIENYRHSEVWHRLVERAMRQSFSWEVPAMRYDKIFKKAIKLRRE